MLKAEGLLLSKRFKIIEKLYRPTSKTFLKVAGGNMHTPHPTHLAIGSATETIKRVSGIFQSLGTINFVLFYQKVESKGGGGGMAQ